MKTGAELITEERIRQLEEIGWTAEHDDDEGSEGELAMAAVCYAAPEPVYREDRRAAITFADPWPWDPRWDSREHQGSMVIPNCELSTQKRVRNLVKAGALIAAETDRLQRL